MRANSCLLAHHSEEAPAVREPLQVVFASLVEGEAHLVFPENLEPAHEGVEPDEVDRSVAIIVR